ncbi:TPA: phage tail protein, partial [Salmonella enterica subsp. diarizonae serovar 50:r:z]
MFHLDNNSGVSAMPPVGTVQSSAPRWFTEGGGGTPASYPGADWYNIIQAELLNFLSAYGIAPDKADLSQLRKAIEAAIKDKATAKSPLLTAIAALVTSADKMPYFNGKDTVAMTALTTFAREVLAQTDAAGVLSKLHLEETVKLAANALSAKIVGEVTNNGTMASANKP